MTFFQDQKIGKTMRKITVYKLDNENSIHIEYDGKSIKITPFELRFYSDYRGIHYELREGRPNKFNQVDGAKKFLNSCIKTYKYYKELIKQTEAAGDFI